MTEIRIDVKGLDEVIEKLSSAPKKLNAAMRNRMYASLETLNENVPPYPPKPPESNYRRTMTLAGSVGVGGAKPTVYSVKGAGKEIEGRFGTDLKYAKYVIDPDRQAYMHRPGYKGRQGWWTMKTIKERAQAKIMSLWQTLIDKVMG
jgi:hypothetical protein